MEKKKRVFLRKKCYVQAKLIYDVRSQDTKVSWNNAYAAKKQKKKTKKKKNLNEKKKKKKKKSKEARELSLL